MAYDQHSNYQPPPRQYYNRGPQPQGRQPTGYGIQNNQYDDYDQGQDAGWDEGYQQGYADPRQAQGRGDGNMAGQRPPPQRQQYQGGYGDMNGHMGRPSPQNQAYGPPQGRMPPPRDNYRPAQTYNDPAYQEQGRGYDQRGRPAQHNGPMNGGMQRGDSRGRGNGRGPMADPGQQQQRSHAKQRILNSPTSPVTLSQDNPFPSFPTAKTKSKPTSESMDEAMSLMNISDHDHPDNQQGRPHTRGRGRGGPGPRSPPQEHAYQSPPPGRGRGYGPPDNYGEDQRQFSGNGRGQPPPQHQEYVQQGPSPMNVEDARPPPQRRGHEDSNPPISPMQRAFGPNSQRAMTLPQELPKPSNQNLQRPVQPQWAEPGPTAGYHGPESPVYIPPPRPATASGVSHHGSDGSNHHPVHQLDSRPIQQIPAPLQQQEYQQERRESLGELYDDYYGAAEPSHSRNASKKDSAMEGDMPNFDAIPDANGAGHRRGYSIDHHLQSASVNNSSQPYSGQEPPQNTDFYQQAQQSRSQPNLYENEANSNGFVFEMPGDIPAVPVMPPIQQTGSTPAVQNGFPGNPRARGPTPLQGGPPGNMGGRGHPNPAQMYGPGQPGQPQDYAMNDPRYQRQGHPPMNRNFSAQSQWSDPGPGGMPRGPPQMGGMPMPRPPGAQQGGGPVGMAGGPMNQRQNMPPTRRSNPDALPSHPMPVRPGLMDQSQTSSPQSSKPPAKPPPVRQYNNNPSPGAQNAAPQTSAMPPLQKRVSTPHPVTFDELNRLRNTFKLKPSDNKTGLLLAKKLVEAAVVLSDEGGRADTRTRNKNREKFIFEAHKIIKKLVSAGNPEAMFYLADCYGQGSLGLEVDPKEAFTLYQSAAKAGHAASAYRTAVCCEMGNEEGGGTRKDPLKAVQWYKRAAALGDTAAQYKVGMIMLKGLLGQQQNVLDAVNMLKRAADRADEDNPHALHELGLLYEMETGNERIIRDELYAFSLFKQAAELGYKFSQFRVAQAYEFGLMGCPVDHRMSIAWYTRAAAQEEHQSELALSGWYLTGSPGILEQSDTEAYLWARKAACAEPPLGKALFAMGYYTEVGIGCPRSLEEAKRWYGRAAAYRFPKAQERLDELKRGGAKVQRSRERLSRSNQTRNEADCVVM